MKNFKLNENIKKIINGFNIKQLTNIASIIGVTIPLSLAISSYNQKNPEKKIPELPENTIIYTNVKPTKEPIITETFDVKPTPTPQIDQRFVKNPIVFKENEVFYFNPEYINEYLVKYVIKEDVRMLASLTFDDGPTEYTKELLDVLDKYNIKATFFVIGKNIDGNEEAIIDAYNRGHEIGIHTYNHEDLTNMTLEEVKQEIELTKEKLQALGIKPSSLVRPPYGKVNKTILENIENPIVTWSVDTEDWKTTKPWKVRTAILEGVEENAIILLHDGRKTTIEGLENVLPLIVDDYKFTTVSNLFKENEIEIEKGIKYRKIK